MTHEELLAKIDKPLNKVFANHQEVKDLQAALRAVVELHKPVELKRFNGEVFALECSICYWNDQGDKEDYPCPTIQAIEKELK